MNNNVVVVENDEKKDIIVMGKGIAFGKKQGDWITLSAAEKIFLMTEEETSTKFKELVKNIPLEHILISEEIIAKAKEKSPFLINDNIYITLTDHISNAIGRQIKGISLENSILWDIKQFYPSEFEMGQMAIKMINDKLQLLFSEDEAGFIAMHFVNAIQYTATDTTSVSKTTQIVKAISQIVGRYLGQTDAEGSRLAHYRFINHIRFLAQRILTGTVYEEDEDGLLDPILTKYDQAYACVKDVSRFILETYAYPLTKEEEIYLTIHISRLQKRSR